MVTLYRFGLQGVRFSRKVGTEDWSLFTSLGAEGLVFLERLGQRGLVSLYRFGCRGVDLSRKVVTKGGLCTQIFDRVVSQERF